MDFADQIRELIALLDKNKDHVSTEEATKHSLVMPFLQVLGYNVFDPTEVIPEFIADVGVKKGEKVDYAIAFNKEPMILIEIKTARSVLQSKVMSQLLRYFGVTKAKFAVLTNGIQYQFFSDFAKKNVMDMDPFLTVNLTPAIRDSEISELKRFHKNHFDADKISSSAVELKYTGELKRYFKQQFKEPEEDFLKFSIKKTTFEGMATKQAIDRFSPIVQNAFKQYINETVSDTLRGALEEAKKVETGEAKEEPSDKQILRQRFWTQFLSYARTETDLHAKNSPTDGGWIAVNAGVRGASFGYSVAKNYSTVELYIDRGKETEPENENIFDRLASVKSEIEQVFGGPLEFDRMEGKRACRLRKRITAGGYLHEQEWPQVHEAMVKNMIQMEKAVTPHLQKLKAEMDGA
jgi:predicted type IV restriction endonuclease